MPVFSEEKNCIRSFPFFIREGKYGISDRKIPSLPHTLYAGFLYDRIICSEMEDFEALETAIELEWGR